MKALTLFLLLPLTALAEPAPFIAPTDDAAHFGDPEQILFWTPSQQVSGYRNMDRLVPVREVRAGGKPLALPILTPWPSPTTAAA
jgi:hypothetical protein